MSSDKNEHNELRKWCAEMIGYKDVRSPGTSISLNGCLVATYPDLLAPENLYLLMDAVEGWVDKQASLMSIIGHEIRFYKDTVNCVCDLVIYCDDMPAIHKSGQGKTKSLALALAWRNAVEGISN